ncbi:MAG: hypothetical protein AAGN66_29240 [Acidobacteriota bacterium]
MKLWPLPLLALLACSEPPPDPHRRLMETLRSDVVDPSLTEESWHRLRSSDPRSWRWAERFCRDEPHRPNCAAVRALVWVEDLGWSEAPTPTPLIDFDPSLDDTSDSTPQETER